jgi:hypothetical protein
MVCPRGCAAGAGVKRSGRHSESSAAQHALIGALDQKPRTIPVRGAVVSEAWHGGEGHIFQKRGPSAEQPSRRASGHPRASQT